MKFIQRIMQRGFDGAEDFMTRFFGASWNPLYQLGALGFYFLWVVVVSGIYLYIFFDTSIDGAFASVEYLTHEQRWFGGIMRSLHRYASDALVLVVVLHMLREFAKDRYRGGRWFSWVTGVPAFIFVIVAGISGYWLVWDELAQYIALASGEWLDILPIFGSSVVSNFLTEESLSDRFFTLLVFLHIAVPLFLLFILWIHLLRIARSRINPARGLTIGVSLTLILLSVIKPAVSHDIADLSSVPAALELDWFYLPLYPLVDIWSGEGVWALCGLFTLFLIVMPWIPPRRKPAPAVVFLDHCNGCGRCVEDCPYNAVSLGPRSDGAAFTEEAVVNTSLCVSCGICAGACPSSTPFRRAGELITGIDLPQPSLRQMRDRTEAAAKKLSGKPRLFVFGCDHTVAAGSLSNESVGVLALPCVAALPPSFIDYVLSRDLADGVVLLGCAEGDCYHRFGIDWTKGRIAGSRDPYLRKRVARNRIKTLWLSAHDRKNARRAIAAFADEIGRLDASQPQSGEKDDADA